MSSPQDEDTYSLSVGPLTRLSPASKIQMVEWLLDPVDDFGRHLPPLITREAAVSMLGGVHLSGEPEIGLTTTPASLPAAGPWIPVTERMPEPLVTVLMYGGTYAVPSGGGHYIGSGIWNGEWYFDDEDGRAFDGVTHWAELRPPEGT